MAQDPVICTAIDNDWGDEQPNLLMHPPCECPRCAPEAAESRVTDTSSWLRIPGQEQRMRVEAAKLGESGRLRLG